MPAKPGAQPAVPGRNGKAPPGAAGSGAPRRWAPIIFAGTLALLVGLYTVGLLVLRPPSPGRSLTFTRVIGLATAQKVRSATFLDEDSRIVGRAVLDDALPPQKYWTSYPKSDAVTNELVKTLNSNGAIVRVDPQGPKRTIRFLAQFLLPLVILANLFALLFSLPDKGGSGVEDFFLFGQAGDKRLATHERQGTTFADVAGADEAVAELAEVRDYLADARLFREMGAQPPKGVLLVGPPGCGKTLLARAVAGEAHASFFAVSGSEFVESLVGVGAARVRDLFAQARASLPAIVFVDELDGVGRKRGAGLGQGHDEREQTLNELLVQMDGFAPGEGLMVIAATNRPDILDPALLRAGRFDRHITVDHPDVEGRLKILQLHARGRRLGDPEADLAHIAQHSAGFTGADLSNVLNEAALLAVRERASAVGRHHLEEAVDRGLSGPKRKGQLLSDEEKRKIAYHESGHAVVASAVGKGPLLQKISVVSRGRGVGHLAVGEDKVVFGRGDMEAQVAIALAGFVAEELVFGEPSTGSEQDLERATTTARDMAGRYGMSSLGLVRVLRENREVFLGRDYLSSSDVSQPTLEHLDAEVARILGEQAERGRSILATHRGALDDLAAALMTKETIQGAELRQALADVRPHRPRPARAPGPPMAANRGRRDGR